MIAMLHAHPLTVFLVAATVMVTPLYLFATYLYSDASLQKGMKVAVYWLIFGAFMTCICVGDVPRRMGLAGNLIVPLVWIIPGMILYLKKEWFLGTELSQRWLAGLQIFRVIGAVFIIEMSRNNLPAVFAKPAGYGDMLVGAVALFIILKYAGANSIPRKPLFFLIGIGMVDFIVAFFFGFTSSDSPLQLFSRDAPNQVLLFPTGMIPLFLVPYTIFFHVLSGLNYVIHAKEREKQ